jgi:hypothetical protein
MLGMINNYTKTAKHICDQIGQEKEINKNRDSNDDDLQKFDHDDISATNFEEIPVN